MAITVGLIKAIGVITDETFIPDIEAKLEEKFDLEAKLEEKFDLKGQAKK